MGPVYRIRVRCNDRCDGGCAWPDAAPEGGTDFYGYHGSPIIFGWAEATQVAAQAAKLRATVTDHDYEVVEVDYEYEEDEAA